MLYAYGNETRRKKVEVLTTRGSRLVSHYVFNPVRTRFLGVDFLSKPWAYYLCYISLYGDLARGPISGGGGGGYNRNQMQKGLLKKLQQC